MHRIIRNLLIPTTGLALVLVAGCSSNNDNPYTDTTGDDHTGGDNYGGGPPSDNISDARLEKSGAGLATLGQSSLLVIDEQGQRVALTEDREGFSLYVFDKDEPGVSSCNTDSCIANWPPLLATADATLAAPYTVIDREDGFSQWAIRDKPLYYFAGDTQAGDAKGHNVGTDWHLATAEPMTVAQGTEATQGAFWVASGNLQIGSFDGTSSTSAWADKDQFSLYTFAKDPVGESACNQACLASWPPLLAPEGTDTQAPFSIIARDDGQSYQWAYHDKPLYFYANDTYPGDTLGDDVAHWQLARPHSFVTKDSGVGSILGTSGIVQIAQTGEAGETVAYKKQAGSTLYTFSADIGQQTSQCTDACLENWPALVAGDHIAAEPPYSIIERSSGIKQWALMGQPLYLFAQDNAPSDANGDGVGEKWHAARAVPIITAYKENAPYFVAQLFDWQTGAAEARNGFTLYTFDNDPANESSCYGNCESNWPPLWATADAQGFGDFSIVARSETEQTDVTYQWAYQGQPLYFYAGDTQAGDTTGDTGGLWKLARPQATASQKESSTGTGPSY